MRRDGGTGRHKGLKKAPFPFGPDQLGPNFVTKAGDPVVISISSLVTKFPGSQYSAIRGILMHPEFDSRDRPPAD
jgi:hypothetical protein